MILELFRALLFAGLPVGAASYFLFSWYLRRRSGTGVTSLRALERDLKQDRKERSKRRKEQKRGLVGAMAEGAHFSREQQLDLVHNKWLKFGGGFYGVVGLLTYAVVELGDVWNFLVGFESLWSLISQFGLDMLIRLFVEALRNFIVAIAWPAYWLSSGIIHEPWLWFPVAYGGYWGGARLALQRLGAQRAVG